MHIPEDWLIGRVDPSEVEEQIAAEGATDLWLAEWRRLVGRLAQGEELWEYGAVVAGDPTNCDWDECDIQHGYAVVSRGVVIDAILAWD